MRIKFILLFLVATLALNAQEKKSLNEILKNGIKFNFTEDGKNFAKVGFGAQIWSRYISLNPGTKDFDGKELKNDFDVSLRRTTFSFFAKLDKFTFFSLIGVSSQPNNRSTSPFTQSKKNAEFFMYDVWGSYNIIPKHLTMGMGLHMYNGLSRYSSATSSACLCADVPIIAASGLLTNFQGARQLGIFATGKFGKFDYRLNLAKPFIADNAPNTNPVTNTTYETSTRNLGVNGYFTYQFWDQESNVMPFTKSTYIGTKKVLNIGAGFEYHPESTKSFHEGNITTIHDKKHFAVDVFMDLPLANNDAITFYAGAFKFDYGTNYLLSYGVMDTYGGGIREPQHGTGSALETQLAYLIPNKDKNAVRIQPYYTLTYKDFDALNSKALHHNIGSNFFFAGHKIKFGLEYQIRPVFNGANLSTYKGMFIGKMAFSI